MAGAYDQSNKWDPTYTPSSSSSSAPKATSGNTAGGGSTPSQSDNKASGGSGQGGIWVSDTSGSGKSSGGGSSGGGSSGGKAASNDPKGWGAKIDANASAFGTTETGGSSQSASPSASDFLAPNAGDTSKKLLETAGITGDKVNIGRVNNIDIEPERQMLKQLTDAQKQQAVLSADNTVSEGIKELQRSQQDAQEAYQAQRNQISRDEQKALDNQVLYNESRGDRGGIGQAQYNSIQNTAATNRLTVQNAQTKMASDTARSIADLRAKGEFEKANQLLSITQNHLSQLMSLEQWAKEANVGIDEFNLQIEEWENNYRLSLLDAEINTANATGAFSNGTPTYAAYAARQTQLANLGNAMMQAGVAPNAQQIAAMGGTRQQAIDYLTKYF